MSQFALVSNGVPTELQGGRSILAGEVQHPWAITYLWSAQELAAIGVYPIVEPITPEGKVSTGSSLVFANGVVTREHTYADIPVEQIQQRLYDDCVAYAQKRLDDFAATRGYAGILSAATYATSSVPKFAAEGQCCVDLRDQTWAALWQLLDNVQAGTEPMPATAADTEPYFPVLEWPA